MTGLLVSAARWLGPSMPADLIASTRPATYTVAVHAEDELALTVVWASLAVLSAGLMVVLAAAGSQISGPLGGVGLRTGKVLAAGSVCGLCIHCLRYMIAETSSRLGERRFQHRTGMKSAVAARVKGDVEEQRHPVISVLTKSTDLDLLVQLAVGLAIAIP
jgi:hypothetical protein